MINMKLNFGSNIDAWENELLELVTAVDPAIEETLTSVARRMQRLAKNKIRGGPKTGRVYRRYNPARTHQASAPGESPADDTGRLAAGIHTYNLNTLDVTVTAEAPYSAKLEYGGATPTGGYIAPRPYWMISFYEAVDNASIDLKKNFEGRL